MNKFILVLFSVLAVVTTVISVGFKDVILEPINDSPEEVCIIFMQGADISPHQYVPLLKTVQTELPDYKLWVSLSFVLLSMAVPLISHILSNFQKYVIVRLESQNISKIP